MNEKASKQEDSRRLIIGIIIIGAFISSLNQTVMTASLPKIMNEFQVDAGVGQWLTTAYLLFMGVMIPCTGYLMEHFSPKKLYLISVSLFFVGCTIAAFAPNIQILLAARIIQALGAGILLPLPQVVAFRLYEPEKRGMIMGIVGLTTGFAPAFGPTFAGWMVDGFGWRSIFYIMCVLAVLGILLALFKLPEEQMHAKGKLDILSVILSTIGFCGLLIGVTNQGNYGISSAVTFVPFFLGIICVTLFAVRQLKLPSPLLELRVFSSRNFTFGTVLLIFAYGSMLSVSTLMPVYIQNLRGYTATISGLVMLPGAMFLAFLNPLTGRILDKRGPYLLSLAGLICLGGATLGLSFIGEATPLPVITLIYAFRMLGIVALLQPLQTWAVNSVDSNYVAHGTALMNTIRQVGGAIVSAMLVTIMTITAKANGEMKGIQGSFFATSIIVLICLVIAAIFMRQKGGKEAAEDTISLEKTVSCENESHPIIITIAREYGSGGREIGQKVAQSLGIPFYDRELIAMETKETGFSIEYVQENEQGSSADHMIWDWAARSYGSFETQLFETGNFNAADQMFQAQQLVIQKIAKEGSCVIIDRCANYILRNQPECLSLFICSDTESKRIRIQNEYGIPPEKSDAEMKRKDGERAFHHKRYTGESWEEPKNYNIVLNSGLIGIDKCVKLVVDMVSEQNKQ